MKRILIIDDEVHILLMLKKMLEKAGYEVDLARNGQEGIDLYNKSPVDLIITDIVMPEKEGLETIVDIKSKHPEIKIIAISGGGRMDPREYLEPAKHFGASKILKKPFNQKEIVSAVKELIGD
ncbi:MAG: response regulator [Bacteroidales bacterium]|nr:MAG: response regulator [Bacteroidales bacterium]